MLSRNAQVIGRSALLPLLSLALAGCTLIHLRQETAIIHNSAILVGTVSGAAPLQDMPIIVAAYPRRGTPRTVVHHTRLHTLGPYELIVPKGEYRVIAFADGNRNLVYDKGEPVGEYVGDEYVIAPAGGVVGELDIVVSGQAADIGFPIGSAMPLNASTALHSTAPGAIADLGDALFSSEYGSKGLWMPLEFFREVGGNIYFLEAYDPTKIPVLFVHGAAGSPQDWVPLFEAIDRDRFQPWFFYYPSGSSLDSMSHLLFWKLLNLQTKYGFNTLCITAHSMGGLVVRSFLVNFGDKFPCISTFISISTPWGGEELAERGVKYSPAVIPAWRGMQPEGEFIQSIFRKRMPSTVEHFLLFWAQGQSQPTAAQQRQGGHLGKSA